jgi:hypothetical protein
MQLIASSSDAWRLQGTRDGCYDEQSLHHILGSGRGLQAEQSSDVYTLQTPGSRVPSVV